MALFVKVPFIKVLRWSKDIFAIFSFEKFPLGNSYRKVPFGKIEKVLSIRKIPYEKHFFKKYFLGKPFYIFDKYIFTKKKRFLEKSFLVRNLLKTWLLETFSLGNYYLENFRISLRFLSTFSSFKKVLFKRKSVKWFPDKRI